MSHIENSILQGLLLHSKNFGILKLFVFQKIKFFFL